MTKSTPRRLSAAAFAIVASAALTLGTTSTEAWGGKTTNWEKPSVTSKAGKTTNWEISGSQSAKTTNWE